MNWLHALIVGAAIAWAGAQNAHAGRGIDRATGQAVWDAAVKGRTTTIGTGAGAMKVISPAGTSSATASGGTKVTGSGNVPVDGKNVPVGMSGEVAKDAIVGGVIGCATGGLLGCALGAGVPLATAYFGLSGARVTPSGDLELPDPNVCTMAPCYAYYVLNQSPKRDTPAQACDDYAIDFVKYSTGYKSATTTTTSATRCDIKAVRYDNSVYTGYSPIYKNSAPPKSPTWYPATPQQVKDALYNNNPPPGIVDELAKFGNITWPLGNPQVTGPSEVKGPKTTSTTQDGNRTITSVSQDSTPLSYSGPSVTAGNTTRTTTTTTTTTNPDGTTSSQTSTTSSTTEQVDVPDDATKPPPEDAPTDTPLPAVPDLYTRKYPGGMEGIYNQYKDQLKNTSLVQLASQLMPNVGNGGTCPVWVISLDFESWAAFGSHDVAPPCWIWDVAKAICILGALLMARALIFGG
ncbi:hypothetical protein ACEN9J_25845 [Variovorax sp. Varisp41]|uniref:hypothetical protein n=1 Tax=Variovorax sp. Varisp41 TaxID=3243033 RepID=UPI0039B63C91